MTELNIDEYPIGDIPSAPGWSENFAVMFSNPDKPVSVFYSIGRWHSDPTLWRELILVSLPNGNVLSNKGYGRNGTPEGPGAALSRYRITEPGASTQLTFDGPMWENSCEELTRAGIRPESAKRCIVDLHFESAAPIYNMDGSTQEAATLAGSLHIDHIGKSFGSIVYDGQTFEFSGGFSIRDHSRGVRSDVSHYGGHNWLMGSFPGGRSFYVYAMRLQGTAGIGMQNAAVTQGDKLYPAKLIHTEFLSERKEIGQSHRIALESELGQMEIEVYKVLNSLPSCMVSPYDTSPGWVNHRWSGSFIDESVCIRWDGKEGYGWSERGFGGL